MGKNYEEKEIEEMVNSCREFISETIRPFDASEESSKVVYAQLLPPSDKDGKRVIEIDIFPEHFMTLLSDWSSTKRYSFQFHMKHVFMYRFVGKSDSKTIRALREMAEENNAWIKTTIFPENTNIEGIKGKLTLRCGEVSSKSVILANHSRLSKTEEEIVNGVTNYVDKCINREEECLFPEKIVNKPDYDVKLFRVGNANTSLVINTQNKKSLMIDCGRDKNTRFTHKYSFAEKEIQQLNPEYIVISHNHEDHFNLLFLMPNSQSIRTGINTSALEGIYMIESINTKFFSEKMLKAYFGNKLHLVKRGFSGGVVSTYFPNIYLNTGECKLYTDCIKPTQKYFENETGIIVDIRNKKNVIFSGDCSYQFFTSIVDLSEADYIIVPHHGGKAKMSKPCKNSRNCIALISSGYKQFVSSSSSTYISRYAQEPFLISIGITDFKFLEAVQGTSYSFKA